MQDRPTMSELLEAVQHFLEADAVPALEGTKKFHARVAANVVGIVRRELQSEAMQLRAEWERLDGLLGPTPMPAERGALCAGIRARTAALCERIRNGDADTEPWRTPVLAHVRQTVADKLAVANPKFLGAAINASINAPSS